MSIARAVVGSLLGYGPPVGSTTVEPRLGTTMLMETLELARDVSPPQRSTSHLVQDYKALKCRQLDLDLVKLGLHLPARNCSLSVPTNFRLIRPRTTLYWESSCSDTTCNNLHLSHKLALQTLVTTLI
ncbi:hypothetical protein RJT34_00582 [Clitoria ternatea]|uniref:Uncharacterized protein n=1 Tax=Clitoria ternatea TaxID=43366 RepID=A0AAN9Q2T3_CLITE